jgi:pimeloyl-ACP methyl ester carboxylesterase
MRPLLAQIRCPALVIQGEHDEHATPQHAGAIAAAIGAALEPRSVAELWLAEGAAHMLPQEIPEVFNQKLIEFLQRSSA